MCYETGQFYLLTTGSGRFALEAPAMSRVIAYVDGFNLYFGLRAKRWKKYYWLDLYALAASLIKPVQTLEAVHYFTARIRANGRNTADMQRQTAYLEASATRPKTGLHFGHYLEKPRQCRSAAHSGWTLRKR